MDWLKGFELDLWWNKFIAVGVALAVPALAASERGLLILAVGMVAAGFGESLNHRRLVQFTEPSVYLPQQMVTSYVRMNHPLGLLLDALGILLVVFGLYRLLTA